jgi:NADH-quinone oxidoreductase subunit G
MPTFKLDDREIPFEPGDTIIRAAHRVGVDIPHYCWHPGLSVAANCRMCLVEVAPPPGRPALMLDVLRWDADKQAYVKETKPKLVPACQQPAGEGMEVRSQSSEQVAKARASVQELMLLNHPVDCPICDQAGECRLQDYWLTNGRRPKRMSDELVHKPKAVSFGPHIVYDAERCIICTRCVRVSAELAKDPVLSVRERGNLNEIAVAPGRQLDHQYSLMTEHVCPVGALTSKEFRFKARVWFLRSVRSVCTGCSRGCSNFVDFDPRAQKVHRYRPRENQAVNRYWMCDQGMLSYQQIHSERLLEARIDGRTASVEDAVARAGQLLGQAERSKIAIVLGAQYSLEDNYLLHSLAINQLSGARLFATGRPAGDSDDILIRADKNPNSAGVAKVAGGKLPLGMADLVSQLAAGQIGTVLVLGSQEQSAGVAQALVEAKAQLVVLATHYDGLAKVATVALPASSWAEYEGRYLNEDGIEQVAERAIAPQGQSLPAWKLISSLARSIGRPFPFKTLGEVRQVLDGQAAVGSQVGVGVQS